MNLNRTLRNLLFLALLTVLSGFPAFSQAPAASPEATIFLRKVDWAVDGRSRLFALRIASEIDGDERFASQAEFDAWMADTKQILMNQRVLDSVSIEATYGTPDASGAIPADILISVRDTWNIVALPKPQYDSNDGIELILKARDYNFFGTMQPLRFDLGYMLDDEPFRKGQFSKGSYIAEIDSTTPFTALGYNWIFDFDHLFKYTYRDPIEYENKTGFSIDVPVAVGELTFGVYQGFRLNDENGDDYKAEYGERLDGWYLSNWLETYWTIPTGFQVDGWGELKYIPRAIVNNNYLPGGGDIGEERRGPTIELGHQLAFGRVDWIGNFRRGVSATVDNDYIYNLHTADWSKGVSASFAGYAPLADFLGASSRLTAGVYFDDPKDDAGEALRGIMDADVTADKYLFLNVDVPVRVISFMPYKWFGKKWMKVFEFEQHWSPFVDLGFVEDDEHGLSFSASDALVAAGLEVITFPKFMRSFYIRISAGFDLRTAWEERQRPGLGDLELFIGLNHSY